MQIDPFKPKLKPPGTTPLKLECHTLHSTFAFKFSWRRYTKGKTQSEQAVAAEEVRLERQTMLASFAGELEPVWAALGEAASALVGKCRLTPWNPR
jgi:hypothetical protein